MVAALSASRRCVGWAQGPFQSYGLIDFLRYVDFLVEAQAGYHLEGFTMPPVKGYRTTWFSFDFAPKMFEAIMRDKNLDLETVQLSMLFVPESGAENVIETAFYNIGTGWVLRHQAIALTCTRHFEGCHILGDRNLIDPCIALLKS